MGLNIKELFKKKEVIEEEPPLPAYPDSEEEKPSLDFSKMKRSDEELGIAMDGWSDFLSESPISEDILLEIQQPSPEDFDQLSVEETDTPEITLSEKFISDLETIHEKPEEFVPSMNFSAFKPLSNLNATEEETDPLAAFLRWSDKNPQKNVPSAKKFTPPEESKEAKAVIPGDDAPQAEDGKLNALLFIDDFANGGNIPGKSDDNKSGEGGLNPITEEASVDFSGEEPGLTRGDAFISADSFDDTSSDISAPVTETVPESESFPNIVADSSQSENYFIPESPGEEETEKEIDVPVSFSSPEVKPFEEENQMSLDDVFKTLSSGGSLSDEEMSSDDSMVLTSEMMASVYSEEDTVSSVSEMPAETTQQAAQQPISPAETTQQAAQQPISPAETTQQAAQQPISPAETTQQAASQNSYSFTETQDFSVRNNAAAALKFFEEEDLMEGLPENAVHFTLEECGKIENLLNYLNYLMEYAPSESQNSFYKSGYLTKITCLSKIFRYKCGVWSKGEYRHELQRLIDGLQNDLNGDNFEILAHYLDLMARSFKDKADRAEFLGKIQAIRRRKMEEC